MEHSQRSRPHLLFPVGPQPWLCRSGWQGAQADPPIRAVAAGAPCFLQAVHVLFDKSLGETETAS